MPSPPRRKRSPVGGLPPVADRAANLLRRTADAFERRRFEISAWMCYEVGKPWREADADVAEAIDFCRFYAAEMERLSAPRVAVISPASGTSISMMRVVLPLLSPPGTSRSRS